MDTSDIREEDYIPSQIPLWMNKILSNLGVNSMEATFSGCGDSGQMDDLILNVSPESGKTELEIVDHLKEVKIRLSSRLTQNFWDLLADSISTDADPLGNYSDGDGGSIWMRITVTPDGASICDYTYTPGEPDYDEYDDDDWTMDY